MENLIISNNVKLSAILLLASSLQNKGLGHIMVDLSGHVNKINVRIYEGGWDKTKNYLEIGSTHTTDEKGLTQIIDTLEAILLNGLEALPNYKEAKDKELAKKWADLRRLQAELTGKVELGEAA